MQTESKGVIRSKQKAARAERVVITGRCWRESGRHRLAVMLHTKEHLRSVEYCWFTRIASEFLQHECIEKSCCVSWLLRKSAICFFTFSRFFCLQRCCNRRMRLLARVFLSNPFGWTGNSCFRCCRDCFLWRGADFHALERTQCRHFNILRWVAAESSQTVVVILSSYNLVFKLLRWWLRSCRSCR